MSGEIIGKVKNTNKEQEALQREQADWKEPGHTSRNKKHINWKFNTLRKVKQQLNLRCRGKCELESEEMIQNTAERGGEGEGERKRKS